MMNTEVAQASSNEAFCTQPPSLHPKLIREWGMEGGVRWGDGEDEIVVNFFNTYYLSL